MIYSKTSFGVTRDVVEDWVSFLCSIAYECISLIQIRAYHAACHVTFPRFDREKVQFKGMLLTSVTNLSSFRVALGIS